MIALLEQAFYVTGLPKYLRIVYLQIICSTEGYKGNFIAHLKNWNDIYV